MGWTTVSSKIISNNIADISHLLSTYSIISTSFSSLFFLPIYHDKILIRMSEFLTFWLDFYDCFKYNYENFSCFHDNFSLYHHESMRNGGDQSKKYENNFVVSRLSSSTSFLGNGSNLFVCIWSCTNKAWCYKEIVDGLALVNLEA